MVSLEIHTDTDYSFISAYTTQTDQPDTIRKEPTYMVVIVDSKLQKSFLRAKIWELSAAFGRINARDADSV